MIPLEKWDLPPLLTLRSVVASQPFRDVVTAWWLRHQQHRARDPFGLI